MDSAPVLMDEKFLLQVLRQNYTDISFQDVDDVDELDLDFKGIMKIELLTNFTNLVTLNLNGNRIQKIQGLDGLVNLKWLHLSFNRIKKMEGLESLRKLEVLDLSNNRISAIENMDTLENLTHFAIRNNLISEISNVMYLRRFKELYQVYFSGNPISEEGEYEMFIAAFLPTVRGLDKIRFDKETKEKARANYKSALDMLDEEEVQKQQDAEAQMRKEAELKLHKDAFVESFNGPCMFKSMFEDDPEAARLSCIPGMASHLQEFEGQMMKLFKSLFDSGLAEHKRREAELNAYFSGQADTTKYYREKATEVMDKYDEQHDEVILKVMKLHVSDKDLIHAEIEPRFGEIQPLVDRLMMINSELTDNLNENLSTLDSCISEMVDDFCKTAKEIFDQCQDLEKDYHLKVQQTAVATLEKVAQGNLDKDEPDEDTNAVMSALATSHDNHLLKIRDWENQLLTRANAWKVSLIKGFQEKEVIHDSTRISDIHRYGQYIRGLLKKAPQMARK